MGLGRLPARRGRIWGMLHTFPFTCRCITNGGREVLLKVFARNASLAVDECLAITPDLAHIHVYDDTHWKQEPAHSWHAQPPPP